MKETIKHNISLVNDETTNSKDGIQFCYSETYIHALII